MQNYGTVSQKYEYHGKWGLMVVLKIRACWLNADSRLRSLMIDLPSSDWPTSAPEVTIHHGAKSHSNYGRDLHRRYIRCKCWCGFQKAPWKWPKDYWVLQKLSLNHRWIDWKRFKWGMKMRSSWHDLAETSQCRRMSSTLWLKNWAPYHSHFPRNVKKLQKLPGPKGQRVVDL